MTNTNPNRLTQWLASLAQMRWSPKQAVRSASLALSRAAWLGIDRNEAIQAVLEVAEFPHFQANPHILFETWATVSEQLGSPDRCELLAA